VGICTKNSLLFGLFRARFYFHTVMSPNNTHQELILREHGGTSLVQEMFCSYESLTIIMYLITFFVSSGPVDVVDQVTGHLKLY